MARRVAHDGAGKLEIHFDYNEALKDLVKSCVPRRRFDWDRKVWIAPEAEVVSVVDLLRPEGFDFDEATLALYDAQAGEEPDHYTVTRLNQAAQRAMMGAFPEAVWLVGQLHDMDKAQRRAESRGARAMLFFRLIEVDEAGGTEFYTGGAKLVLLDGADAKYSAADLTDRLANAGKRVPHQVQPSAVSITQATELGAVYSLDEIAAIVEVARGRGMGVHMDGARFANAVASLGCSPAEVTWKSGVDVLSFGSTKNGAMGAEAVVFFDPAKVGDFIYRRMSGGHLASKMRFLSAQLEAYITDNLWLENAAHANACAKRIADGLTATPGARLFSNGQANEVFIGLPEAVVEHLEGEGHLFHRWCLDGDRVVIRLIAAWNTEDADVDALLASVAAVAG